MTPGRLIAVVGPSGVGKDSVMRGIHSTFPDIHLVRRVITRMPDLGGEDHEAVSAAQFADLAHDGAFAVHWKAHGLEYGIPIAVQGRLSAGTDCIVNFSREALPDAAQVFQRMVVLNLTAKPESLARRLHGRARETEKEISGRLARASAPLPEGLDVIHLSNDGPLANTVFRAATLLQPARV